MSGRRTVGAVCPLPPSVDSQEAQKTFSNNCEQSREESDRPAL